MVEVYRLGAAGTTVLTGGQAVQRPSAYSNSSRTSESQPAAFRTPQNPNTLSTDPNPDNHTQESAANSHLWMCCSSQSACAVPCARDLQRVTELTRRSDTTAPSVSSTSVQAYPCQPMGQSGCNGTSLSTARHRRRLTSISFAGVLQGETRLHAPHGSQASFLRRRHYVYYVSNHHRSSRSPCL